MSKPHSFTYILVVVALLLALVGSAAAIYIGTPGLPCRRQLLVGLLMVAAGVCLRNKKEYYLLLWVFIEAMGPMSFNYYIPHSIELNLNYVVGAADLLLVGLYVTWFLEKTVRREPAADYLWPLAGVLIAFVLSVINAQDKVYSVFCTATVLKGMLVFLYVARHAQDPRIFRGILAVLMLSLALQGTLAVLQEISGGNLGVENLRIKGVNPTQELDKFGAMPRVSGAYPSHNSFSALFLDFLIPVAAAMYFAYRDSRWIRRISLFLCGLGVLSLIFTLSRGGWFSFLIGAILFWVGLRVIRVPEKRSSMAPILIAGLVFLLLLPVSGLIFSRLTSNDHGAVTFRVQLMQVAIQAIRSHPWIGVGAGNYTQVMHLYDVSAEGVTRFFLFPVHNLYLYLAAESGIPSLACFILFLLMLLKRSWRGVLHSEEPFRAYLALGFLCGWVASLFHGLFEPTMLGGYFMFWLVSGLLAALPRAQMTSWEV